MTDFSPRLAWSDFALELADALRDIGVSGGLYLVGGSVRDAWLRRPTSDYDIVARGDAIRAARRLADYLQADIYVMDRARGVARLFVDHEDEKLCVDFADMRGDSLEGDLRDRDFTMNAMAADLLGDVGALIDPLGGRGDLQAKVLRRCAPDAIASDPIRGLRAVRLSAQFDLKIHPETALDLRAQARGLARTSPERIRDEFFKLLGLGRAARALRVARHLGLLRVILPRLDEDDISRKLATVERLTALLTAISSRRTDNTAAAFDLGMLTIQLDRFRASLQAHLAQAYGNGRSRGQLLVLAALLAGAETQEPAESLRLSAEEARILKLAAGKAQRAGMGAAWTRLQQHRFWHQLGACGIDVILLGAAEAMARQGAALRQDDWLALVERFTLLLDGYFNDYDALVNPRLLLDGNEVKRLLGIKAGRQIGEALQELREAQVTGEVSTADEAREFVVKRNTQ